MSESAARCHCPVRPTRRQALLRAGLGLGGLSLAALLAESQRGRTLRAAPPVGALGGNPLAPRPSPMAAKAKHLIQFFLNGGPSQVDTFDPKPALARYASVPLPKGNLQTESKTGAALPSPFSFKKHGQSGIDVSELFPHVAKSIDEIAVIRSMQTNLPNHEPALMMMNCGEGLMVRPAVGSWVTYGLGTLNQNLPGFIAMCPGGYPIKASENWQSGFLPGAFQGTFIDTRHTEIDKLIENIRNPQTTLRAQRRQLDLLKRLNERHQGERPAQPLLDARIESFELAFRMQMEAQDAFDISQEPASIRALYGEGTHARQTLIARRLIERGVRFVQLWHGAGQPWDDHTDIEHHRVLAKECDQAMGALLIDLKQRGLLEETLVLWGGEFGRTPTVQLPDPKDKNAKANGRDHNHHGFSIWLAGGGVRGGVVYGATDELGYQAVENPVHVHDLHATILWLLGFDHEQFTYRYAGRDFRLTDVHGRVIEEILA
jgi:hypothetical protein